MAPIIVWCGVAASQGTWHVTFVLPRDRFHLLGHTQTPSRLVYGMNIRPLSFYMLNSYYPQCRHNQPCKLWETVVCAIHRGNYVFPGKRWYERLCSIFGQESHPNFVGGIKTHPVYNQNTTVTYRFLFAFKGKRMTRKYIDSTVYSTDNSLS